MAPRDHVWHSLALGLPVHPDSDAWIGRMGHDTSVTPGFGATVWMGNRAGIPLNRTDSRVVPGRSVLFSFNWLWMSDTGPYHIPPGVRLEGDPGVAWDRHMILVDSADCTLSELIDVRPPGTTWYPGWAAMAGVRSALSSYSMRVTVDAANLGIAPGLIRYDEVQAGSIDHMIRFCAPTVRAGTHIWPAAGTDGPDRSPTAPPMGARFRLRRSFDASALSREARVVVAALQTHGMVLADTCHRVTIIGEPDPRWNDGAIAELRGVRMRDFVAVDQTPMILDPTSRRVR